MAEVTWEEVAVLTGAPVEFEHGAMVINLASGLLDARLEGEDARRGLLLLAAHLWSVLEPRVISEGVGGLSVQYALPALGEGLAGSLWGQQYLALLRARRQDLPMMVL